MDDKKCWNVEYNQLKNVTVYIITTGYILWLN